MSSWKIEFDRKKFDLTLVKKGDHRFIYNLIKNFLKTSLSVTFLKMPSYNEFEKKYFCNDFKRYVITNELNKKVGFVVITKDDEIGYFLDSKFQGLGIGVKAVKKLMDLNPRERYFATIHIKNKSSIKLIKKLGFIPKATIYEKIKKI